MNCCRSENLESSCNSYISGSQLQKTDFSKFCNFTKIGTHSVPYFPKIRNLLLHNQITRISQKKTGIFGIFEKKVFLGQKNSVPHIPYIISKNG